MQAAVAKVVQTIAVICLALNLIACANLGSRGDPRDPFEGLNRGVYSFNQALDQSIINRIARVYQAITPDFLDRGISNFFSNVNEIIVIINDVLQLKIGQAFSDIARFLFNSTIGIGGLMDVASNMGFPKHNEDFGQSLGRWGISPGPYIVVPALGPSTFRDVVGYTVATTMVSPLAYIDSTSVYMGVMSMNYVDFKADLLSEEKLLEEAAVDKYEFTKNAYLELRENLVRDRESSDLDYEELN
jgi:phospholipid-binding lipoprotein MlaA